MNVPVHWKEFVIETALKIADSLIGALSTEIETHPQTTSSRGCVLTRASYETQEAFSLLHHREAQHTQRKVLFSLFHIHELTDPHD